MSMGNDGVMHKIKMSLGRQAVNAKLRIVLHDAKLHIMPYKIHKLFMRNNINGKLPVKKVNLRIVIHDN